MVPQTLSYARVAKRGGDSLASTITPTELHISTVLVHCAARLSDLRHPSSCCTTHKKRSKRNIFAVVCPSFSLQTKYCRPSYKHMYDTITQKFHEPTPNRVVGISRNHIGQFTQLPLKLQHMRNKTHKKRSNSARFFQANCPSFFAEINANAVRSRETSNNSYICNIIPPLPKGSHVHMYGGLVHSGQQTNVSKSSSRQT